MNRKLSDEQLDRIAENLLQNFAPDDETLDEIAASPKIWWNVRSRIAAEKARREQSRFFDLRWQTLSFGAIMILLSVGAVASVFLTLKTDENIAEVKKAETFKAEETILPKIDEPLIKVESEKPETVKSNIAKTETAKIVSKKDSPKNSISAKPAKIETIIKKPEVRNSTAEIKTETKTETKTDFIALSYSSATDSGQIVRVKVPSSMMVSLGVTTEVEQESKLVNAEVVIGDDGMARAIRFIR